MNKTINVTKSFIESNIARLETCFDADDYEWNCGIEQEIEDFSNVLQYGEGWVGNTRFVLSSFTTKGYGFPV